MGEVLTMLFFANLARSGSLWKCCNANMIYFIKMKPVIIQGCAVQWVWGGKSRVALSWQAASAVVRLFAGCLQGGLGEAQPYSDKCRSQTGSWPSLGDSLEQLALSDFKQSHRLDHHKWANFHLLILSLGLKSCSWPLRDPLKMPESWHAMRKETTLYWSSVYFGDIQLTRFEEKKKKRREKTSFWLTTFKIRYYGHKFLTLLPPRDGIYFSSSWIWDSLWQIFPPCKEAQSSHMEGPCRKREALATQSPCSSSDA